MARLGDVCSINMGQSPDSSTYNDKHEGLPFFQGNADFGEKYPSVRVWCSAPAKVAKAKDILISVRAPIGAVNYAMEECCIGRGLAAISPNCDICNTSYIWHMLRSKLDELNSKGTGSTFKAISRKVLEETEFHLPPLKEQERISADFDIIDNLIALRKQQLAKLDELVKARFVEMFGDPVENSKNWPIRFLCDVCSKLTDGTHFSPESYETGEYRYVTAKNIKVGGFDFLNITYVDAEVHNEIYARCNPEYGDVLYIKDGVTTGIAMVNTLHEPFTMLSSVALLKQDRKIIDGAYLCSVLNNQHMYDAIRSDMGGAAITRLTIAKLNKVKIPVPPLAIQEQFAAFVAQVDKSKLTIQQSLAKIEMLMQALMQKYFG